MCLLQSCKLLRIRRKPFLYNPLRTSVGLQFRILSSKVTGAVNSSATSHAISSETKFENEARSLPKNATEVSTDARLLAKSAIQGSPALLVSQATASKQSSSGSDREWREISTDLSKLPNQYLMLSKFRLTSLVVLTSIAGYAVAPAPFDFSTLMLLTVGTGLTSCAANSINQFFEVPFDSQMSRTKNRILVRGYLTPLHALTFATVCAATGLTTLCCGINGLTATLGALNLVLYTMVYTPMKRISILNTWVGSFVGAIPPLMGWAACTGTLHPGAAVMAGVLYAWQFPHFNALSWNLRPDYSRAGYRMMAVTDPDLCRKTALRYTVALLGLSFAAPLLDVTKWFFVFEAVPLNAYFTYLAWQFYKKPDSSSSRKLFRFSLLHLPLLMVLLLINKKYWTPVKPVVTKYSDQMDGYVVVLTPGEALPKIDLPDTPSVPLLRGPVLASSGS